MPARPLLLAAALLAGTVVPLAPPAVADTGPVPLGISRLVYGHSCTAYLGSGGSGGVGVVDAGPAPRER